MIVCSEQAADGKVHPALARGTYAAGDGDWSDDSVGDEAEIECSAHDEWAGFSSSGAEGGAGFVPSTPVDSLSDELGKAVEFATESEGGIGVVVSKKFVGKVGAETKGAAEREDLERTGLAAERCASG